MKIHTNKGANYCTFKIWKEGIENPLILWSIDYDLYLLLYVVVSDVQVRTLKVAPVLYRRSSMLLWLEPVERLATYKECS